MARFLTFADKFVSLLCILLSVLIFVAAYHTFALPPRWLVQALALAGGFAGLTVAGWFVRNPITGTVLFTVRLAVAILIGFPIHLQFGIEYLLLASLLLEVSNWPSSALMIVAYALAGGSIFVSQRPAIDWDTHILPLRPIEIVNYIIACVTIVTAVELLRWYRDRANLNVSLVADYERSLAALTKTNLRYQESAVREIDRAVADDRRFLIREIHDTVGHAMVNVMMLTEKLHDIASASYPRLSATIQSIRDETERTIHEMERVLGNRRTASPSTACSLSELRRLAEIFSSTGTDVNFRYRYMPATLGKKIDRILYRLVQEALTNAVRHGKATEVTVLFWKRDDRVEVLVEDNGTGATSIHEGIGLWGIREQLAALGGELFFDAGNTGFRLRATIPCVLNDDPDPDSSSSE